MFSPMWPAIIFVLLVAAVLVEALWRERRHRRQRALQQQEYTAKALRQQQEAYAKSQAQQKALFDSTVEGVLLLGLDGKIQLVNQSLQQLFQLRADIRGQTILEAFGLPELTQIAERLHQESTVDAFYLDLPGPERRVVEVNAAAVRDREGNRQSAIFVFH